MTADTPKDSASVAGDSLRAGRPTPSTGIEVSGSGKLQRRKSRNSELRHRAHLFGVEWKTDNGQLRWLLGLPCQLLQLSLDHCQPPGDLVPAMGPFLLPRDEK